ncbi:hypothetical protein V8B97DRAFT_506316 [Scleroderma yunnanense]
MGKLNIAHHKSYHPYRRDNIERVRRDEEEAARQEAEKESRMALADAEARLTLLRDRVGLGSEGKGKGKAVEGDPGSSAGQTGTGIGSAKHINLFEDLEQQEFVIAARANKKSTTSEADKGVPLAPSAKDLNPWYTDKSRDHANVGLKNDDVNDQDKRRMRDQASKTLHDPLTAITHQLAPPSSSNNTRVANDRSRHKRPPRHTDQPPRPQPKRADPTSERLSRESSERERALALIRRKQREVAGSETPSTVHGGMDSGYGDVFNRSEVEEARAHRDQWRKRYW